MKGTTIKHLKANTSYWIPNDGSEYDEITDFRNIAAVSMLAYRITMTIGNGMTLNKITTKRLKNPRIS